MTKARERRRPGGASPIALTPKIEPIQTPGDAAMPGTAPHAPPAVAVAPTPQAVEPTERQAGAVQAPALHTPADQALPSGSTAAQGPAVQPVGVPTQPPPGPMPSAQRPPSPAPTSTPPPLMSDDPKVSRTFQLRRRLLAEAQTAVLRTGGYPGGVRSLNALVSQAVEAELQRLAAEFNDGQRFEPNEGTFRTGRPLGS